MNDFKDIDRRIPHLPYRNPLPLLCRLRLRKQCAENPARFPSADPTLHDVVLTLDILKQPDARCVLACGGRQYLTDSEFLALAGPYDSIVQLHNKTPYAPVLLVTEKNRYGVIDENGRELIPCDYSSIRPFVLKSTVSDDPLEHPVSGEVLLFLCTGEENRMDVYSHDGIPLFHGISGLYPCETAAFHRYDFDLNTHTETTEIKKIIVDRLYEYTISSSDLCDDILDDDFFGFDTPAESGKTEKSEDIPQSPSDAEEETVTLHVGLIYNFLIFDGHVFLRFEDTDSGEPIASRDPDYFALPSEPPVFRFPPEYAAEYFRNVVLSEELLPYLDPEELPGMDLAELFSDDPESP